MIKLKYDMKIIKKEDPDFPWRLRLLNDCPDLIFVLGNTRILNDFSIAIVGSRDFDEYGRHITKKFSSELAKRGVCIVSGLAEGIDTCAHIGAVEANCKTIAVIGNGFDNIYTPSNKKLVDDIITSGGAIISEYLPDQKPLSVCFPARNRIVACMTDGTLVTEAREKSGALITAKIAMRYGKKVFAVPGEADNEKCNGSNSLLSDGAKLVVDVRDILKEYPFYKYSEKVVTNKNVLVREPDVKYLETYSIIGDTPLHISEICKRANCSPSQIMADLTMLEMDGFIEQIAGGFFKKM